MTSSARVVRAVTHSAILSLALKKNVRRSIYYGLVLPGPKSLKVFPSNKLHQLISQCDAAGESELIIVIYPEGPLSAAT